MDLEVFLTFLRNLHNPIWGPCPIPDVVTKENVNAPCSTDYDNRTLLELAVDYFDIHKNVIPILLSLGATIKCSCLLDRNVATYFLDLGANPNMPFKPDLTPFTLFETYVLFANDVSLGNILIDYGGKPKNGWSLFIGQNFQAIFSTRIQNYGKYATLSDRRVQECRKALLALLSTCHASSSHTKGPFGPKGGFAGGAAFGALRDVMTQIASQVWAMRGGEGCGARGHKWFVK